jgi:hypothetical protein
VRCYKKQRLGLNAEQRTPVTEAAAAEAAVAPSRRRSPAASAASLTLTPIGRFNGSRVGCRLLLHRAAPRSPPLVCVSGFVSVRARCPRRAMSAARVCVSAACVRGRGDLGWGVGGVSVGRCVDLTYLDFGRTAHSKTVRGVGGGYA